MKEFDDWDMSDGDKEVTYLDGIDGNKSNSNDNDNTNTIENSSYEEFKNDWDPNGPYEENLLDFL